MAAVSRMGGSFHRRRGQTGSSRPPAQAPVQVSALPLLPPPILAPLLPPPDPTATPPSPDPSLASSTLLASEPMLLIKAIIELPLHAKQCAEVETLHLASCIFRILLASSFYRPGDSGPDRFSILPELESEPRADFLHTLKSCPGLRNT